MRFKTAFTPICITLLCAALLCACAPDSTQNKQNTVKRAEVESDELQFTEPSEGDTIAVFETSHGSFTAVLYESLAPMACENFITLAQQGFFDDTAFDTIVNESYVQAGLSTERAASTIWNGNAYPKETTDKLHHYTGALCAPLGSDGGASSPFYVVQALQGSVSDALASEMATANYRQSVIDTYKAAGGLPTLDYTDTVFGHVYSGMDVVDALANSAVSGDAAQSQAQPSDNADETLPKTARIISVTIETYRG